MSVEIHTTAPVATPGSEQRLTFRLLSYWNRIRAGKDFPTLAEVNITEIAEMYHMTYTLEIAGPSQADHRFLYFGPELAAVFGQNYTGHHLDEAILDPIVNHTIGFYEKVIEARKPCSESSEFHLDGKEIRYRSVILPLSSNGKDIDFLIGTTNYKAF